jgi:hypothetical protein
MEMYQKDYIDKYEARYDEINYSAWLYGSYMIPAIQKALEPKKAKYPGKPYNKNMVTEDGEEIDVYESFRRKMRAMNERISEK